MTREEALEKGFLKQKTVYLKLIPKANALTSDPKHVAYGGFDGSIREYTIGVDKSGRMINPFSSDEERKYFESVVNANLNVYDTNNTFWEQYTYRIIKDPSIIKVGIKFDLSDPADMLDYKVLLTNKRLVCSSIDEYKRNPNPFYELVFVDEDYEESKVSQELDINKKIYMFYGKIEDSPTKMMDFLNVYFIENRMTKQATESMSKETLQAEIGKIINEDRDGFLKIMSDPDYEMKIFVLKGIKAGAIIKEGFSYKITGEDRVFTLGELVSFLNMLKKEKDILYGKIDAQIKAK